MNINTCVTIDNIEVEIEPRHSEPYTILIDHEEFRIWCELNEYLTRVYESWGVPMYVREEKHRISYADFLQGDIKGAVRHYMDDAGLWRPSSASDVLGDLFDDWREIF